MANRSYLYSINFMPDSDIKKEEQKIIGISEWRYDIPIVFKLLLSANPAACKSSIWEMPENIALVGDYRLGVERLRAFLQRIELPVAQPLISEAVEFLNKPENQQHFFLLECGEIFDLIEDSVSEQNLALLEEVQSLEPEIERALQSLRPPPVEEPTSAGFFAKILGAKSRQPRVTQDPREAVYSLGLGNWSNILYFDLSNE